jgi:RNA polymerase sigma-70 factor, ECF subfamily
MVTVGPHEVERVFREERGRILATLIRFLGEIDAAEEALAAAFEAALVQWPAEGLPDNPRAWLVRAGRNKAIDRVRRERVAADKRPELRRAALEGDVAPPPGEDTPAVEDDRLRLIFTCCHPALHPEAQVALTLRVLGGLGTDEIARAFLVPSATMAQRIVRAKNKIRGAGIPYRIPEAEDLPERLDAVLAVIYLIFNEGYAAGSGESPVRLDLCREAIRLGRLLLELLPDRSEPRALMALLLLTDARRATRVDAAGVVVLLEDQDRSRWDTAQIREGLALALAALRGGPAGTYAIQAAIAALHAEAPTAAETDWPQIASLYSLLVRRHPSPVVELNRAVAVAMADGYEAGLLIIDRLIEADVLPGYHWLPAARADLLRRLGQFSEAEAAYLQARALAGNAADQRFLDRRIAEVRETLQRERGQMTR